MGCAFPIHPETQRITLDVILRTVCGLDEDGPLGAAFASFEMKLVLARRLARLELRGVPGYRARIVRRGIAFAPSEGMPVVVERRAA